MRRNKNKTIEITLNMNKDDVEVGDKSLHITTENGIRVELPYEKAEIESDDRIIGLTSLENNFETKNRRNR